MLQVLQPSIPSSLPSIKGHKDHSPFSTTTSSSSSYPHLEFDMADILEPMRRAVAHKALVEAAMKVKAGQRLATVVIYVSAQR